MKIPMAVASVVLVICTLSTAAQAPAPLAALARMPVREVTVFKDGHAFVLHEGTLPTDAAGHVLMDYLPTPVLGTFWPYSSNQDAKLVGVVAGQRRVRVDQTALTLAELIAGNAGAEAIITEKATGANRDPVRYAGTLIGIPERSSDELAATGLPNAAPRTPERATIVLVRTTDGVKVVNVENIQDVTFKAPHNSQVSHEEFRNLLTLQLDWGGRRPAPTADVGLVYVQKGLRWIPGYRVTLDGKGTAALKLQTTLLNELADIDDVTANLVIGVPSFAFKDTMDPISLQQSAAQLSPYFQQGDRMASMSNALMTQMSMGGRAAAQPAGPNPIPDLPESAASEDLFVFTVRHVTMKKGERIVAPVADYTVPYADVFSLDLPYAPPPEVRGNLNDEQESEMARLLSGPHVAHKVRFTNTGSYPMTTAPALILRDNRVLAQGIMTYTAIGASGDLEITKAVDIQVKKSDNETGRIPDARVLDGDTYARINLAGKITLTNYRDKTVEIEVTRHVLGNVTAADHGGVITSVNVFEDGSYSAGSDRPRWWRWYSWPNWWSHFNGVGRIAWTVTLEPGKSADLGYTWHYFWR